MAWTEMNWHWKSLEFGCTACILDWMFICMYVFCNCIEYLMMNCIFVGCIWWNVLLNSVWNISARSIESTLDFESYVQYSNRTWYLDREICAINLISLHKHFLWSSFMLYSFISKIKFISFYRQIQYSTKGITMQGGTNVIFASFSDNAHEIKKNLVQESTFQGYPLNR